MIKTEGKGKEKSAFEVAGAVVCLLKPKAFLYTGKKSGKMFAWGYSKTGAKLLPPPAAEIQELAEVLVCRECREWEHRWQQMLFPCSGLDKTDLQERLWKG